MKTVAIIGARLNSSRLPGKHLLPLAGKPLIERLLQRLHHCKNLDEIVLATTKDSFNKPLTNWAQNQVECYAHSGDVNDLMGRIDAVVSSHNADIIVYICGDCPLIDPLFIEHGIQALKANTDAETIILSPEIKSIHEGIHFYSRKGWNKLIQKSKEPMEREHVGYADSKYHILRKLCIEDSGDYSAVNHRISVDTHADYEFMSQLYKLWYKDQAPKSIIPLDWIISQLQKNSSLLALNAHVIQKNPEHAYQKISLYCHVSKYIGMGHLRRCALIANTLKETYGLGTHIHIQGDYTKIPWLNGQISWYGNQENLFKAMDSDNNHTWIVDFHPEHISTNWLIEICKNIKKRNGTTIIALDKLQCLLDVADKLFIPSFYSELASEKVSFGWDNYILPPFINTIKKKQVTILTGGADALGYGISLPLLLEKNIPDSWEIQWIQGPYAAKPNLPENIKRWHLHLNPSNLQEIISNSKVVVACYGLSLIESLRSNATTLLLPVRALCDAKELSLLKSLNCCFIADKDDDIAILLNQIFTDKTAVNICHQNAVKLVKNINGVNILGHIITENINKIAF
jgi:spore coat polysaccharide biosynthesis protein SpsF (cytidylyltransferase family)